MEPNVASGGVKEGCMSSMKIISSKLGEIEYKEDDIITLSSPFLGFPDLNDFLLISNESSYPFLWFQSVEDPDICFVIAEAVTFFKDYNPTLNKREIKVLAIDDMKEVKIFCIVVVPDDPKMSTANLRAPLVINFAKKLAKQIILDDDTYKIKTPLFG